MIHKHTGIVYAIGNKQQFSSGFVKQGIVLTNDIGDESKYKSTIPFTFKKERCALLDSIRKGQRVTISFAIDGREWDGPKGKQFFVDLTGLKIEDASESAPSPAEPKDVTIEGTLEEIPF